jgi:MSHA biogenesis protein MshP
MMNHQATNYKKQLGLGAIAAIVILVILAVLASAIISISTSQQTTSAQDVRSSKAWQAARAGNEWGLYQALRNNSCLASSTLNLSSETGFRVTVFCDSWLYEEVDANSGTNTVRVYRIKSTACNANTCPATDASVAGANYIERTRTVLATDN